LYGTNWRFSSFVEDDIVFKGFHWWKEKIEVENRSNARMEKIRFYCAQEILEMAEQNWWKQLKLIWRNNESNKYFINQNIDWRAKESILDANLIFKQDFIEIKNNLLNSKQSIIIFSSQNAVLSLIEQNAGKF
jgi:hypothetical protein